MGGALGLSARVGMQLSLSSMVQAGVVFELQKAIRTLVIGDSLAAGRGAGTGAVQMDGARAQSWPTKMRDALQAMGFLATSESWAEASNTGGTLPAYDPRVNLGSWAVGAGVGIGGLTLTTAAAGAPSIFAPAIPIDTVELFLPTNGFGTGTYQFDAGGAPVAFSEGGAPSLQRLLATTTLGMHDMRLNWVAGTLYQTPMVAYDSTKKDFRIINMGMRNIATTGWLQQDAAWRPFPGIGTYLPDITLISLGANDGRPGGAGTSLATFIANMQTLINKATAAGGKVGLVIPPPWNTATQDVGGTFTYAQMVAAYISLGETNSIDVCRTDLLFGSWAAATALGLTFPDELHYNAAGYSLMGPFVAVMVREIARMFFKA